jgi:hypothetical protein
MHGSVPLASFCYPQSLETLRERERGGMRRKKVDLEISFQEEVIFYYNLVLNFVFSMVFLLLFVACISLLTIDLHLSL